MQEPFKRIRRFFFEVREKREIEKAQEIIDSDDPRLSMPSFIFINIIKKLIENEHGLVNFDPTSKVVFIGGGPLPLTPIFLSLFYGVKSFSIEIIPEVAILSRRVIDKLGLTPQIDVVVGDETCVENLDYNVVMVAALAEPKERVFSNIRKQVDYSNPIIYRTYTGMRAIRYAPIPEKVLQGFRTVKIIQANGM